MVYILFVLVAAVTLYAAMKLSTFADVLSTKTSMGGLLVGTILLAGATSLPEVTTSISAVFIDSPDIAVGNVLGSNLFNLFILALFDLYFRSKRLYEKVDRSHFYSAILGIVLTGLALTGLLYDRTPTLLGVGVEAVAMLLLYILGLLWINKKTAQNSLVESSEEVIVEESHNTISVKKAVLGFVIAAIVIMGAGTALSILGDQIATLTGLDASFIGSFLIAATTSLPEAVSVYVALRLRNVNLAFGSILGSNLFNMLIIVLSDVVYNGPSILNVASTSHIITGLAVTFLSFLVMYTIQRKHKTNGVRYTLPSIITVLVYFGTTYLLFIS